MMVGRGESVKLGLFLNIGLRWKEKKDRPNPEELQMLPSALLMEAALFLRRSPEDCSFA